MAPIEFDIQHDFISAFHDVCGKNSLNNFCYQRLMPLASFIDICILLGESIWQKNQ